MNVTGTNRPPLIIGFADYFPGVPEFFTSWLSEEYIVIRDDENPDYLFFCDENFGQKNLEYNNKGCVKIFYTGENRRAGNYACHYAITFDHYSLEENKHYRLPLYVLVDWVLKNKLNHKTILETERNEEDIALKKRFCGFVVSNPRCLPRNDMFHKLSTFYKQVDSAGPLFNNTGFVLPRGDDGIIKKLEFLKECKFSLCYENGSYPGYVTEKLYEAWLGGTVPIYWGSDTVTTDFDGPGFINRNDFVNDIEFINYIKFADVNKFLYKQLYMSKILTHQNRYMRPERFLEWFRNNVWKDKPNV